jgi:ABC-type amino acid transport substrate-binding protein
MSGVPVTPLRASYVLFSEPYLDETLGFVVRDHLRDGFASWSQIRQLGDVKVSIPNIPYYIDMLRQRVPGLQLDVVDIAAIERGMKEERIDALVLPAERGSVLTLLHPKYTVVVPEGGLVRMPLGYALARRDQDWAHFVNTWIELKRRDGSIDTLYRHWVLGEDAVERKPRWSVLRNVLGWVE